MKICLYWPFSKNMRCEMLGSDWRGDHFKWRMNPALDTKCSSSSSSVLLVGDGSECVRHVCVHWQPQPTWHAGVGQRLSAPHLHQDRAAVFRWGQTSRAAGRTALADGQAQTNRWRLCVVQERRTASSWTCCFPAASCWRKSNFKPSWSTNLYTTSKSFRQLLKGWASTKSDNFFTFSSHIF